MNDRIHQGAGPMQVKTGDRVCADAPVTVEAIDDLLFHDYYSRTPRIRLTADPAAERAAPDECAVILDGNDVATVVECAVRHPSLNMRQAVMTAIWNHPESFRQIFRFGLDAPGVFAEIREIVAEELGKRATVAEAPSAGRMPAAADKLLPRLPLPPHLRQRRSD
jgi:hypothetical protein